MKAKYKNGTRVTVSIGHPIVEYEPETDVLSNYDARPQLTKDIATIMYTYGEKSEHDSRYSSDARGYKQYCLKFHKHGEISWFDEWNIRVL